MALYRSPDYQTTFESICFSVQEKKFNIDFQDSGHQNDFIYFLSTSHLDTSNELAFWFRIKKVQNRFSTWLLRRPSWISDQNDFIYFCSTIFKSIGNSFQEKKGKNRFSRWQPLRPSWISLAIFFLQVTPMLPAKFQVNWHFGSGEEAKNMFSSWRSSWISYRNDFCYF